MLRGASVTVRPSCVGPETAVSAPGKPLNMLSSERFSCTTITTCLIAPVFGGAGGALGYDEGGGGVPGGVERDGVGCICAGAPGAAEPPPPHALSARTATAATPERRRSVFVGGTQVGWFGDERGCASAQRQRLERPRLLIEVEAIEQRIGANVRHAQRRQRERPLGELDDAAIFV